MQRLTPERRKFLWRCWLRVKARTTPRTCRVCGLTKDPKEYSKDSYKLDGLATRCKSCDSIAYADRYKKKKEKENK